MLLIKIINLKRKNNTDALSSVWRLCAMEIYHIYYGIAKIVFETNSRIEELRYLFKKIYDPTIDVR